MTWLIIWIIGSVFTGGLIDPFNNGVFRERFTRFFEWPFELGQFVRIYLDGGRFIRGEDVN